MPDFLSLDWLLLQFGKRPKRARQRYEEYVSEGIGQASPLLDLRNQIILGSEEYVSTIKTLFLDIVKIKASARQRPGLDELFSGLSTKEQRNAAIRLAHNTYFYSLSEIGQHIDLHYASVSKIANETV